MRYEIRNATVMYAADLILDKINFEIRDTEKIAIIGRNGCGKTTLLKLISGELEMVNPDSDETCGIFMAGKQQIGYLKQISFADGEITVEKEIEKVFAPIFECEKQMNAIMEQMATDQSPKVMSQYAALQAKMESLNGYGYRQEMETVFQKFGFDLEDLQRPVGEFSGGQQTKIAFVKLLLSKPDIMLLDEPTNHLDMPTIEWLEGYLKDYPKAVVIVSHDRMFLDHVIDVTYEIEYHRMKRYPGNYTTYLKLKEEAAIKQEKDYEEQQAEIKRLTEWVEKWKNTPTKVTAARSKLKAIEHMELIEKPRRFDTRAFQAEFTPRSESYRDVITARNLEIGYDTVLSKTSFVLHKGERIAVIGENGKGKSTLLRTLIGQIPSLGGEFRFGTGVEWGYFDQQAAMKTADNPKQTIINNFWDAYPHLVETQVRNALGNFLFTQDDVFKELGQLSGGEKVRLELCKMFKKLPNLLILDEPTNHMDIVGKEALENMLKNYTGTVIFVSHDRYFVKEVATNILDFENDQVNYYPCGYEQYLHEREKLHARLNVSSGNATSSTKSSATGSLSSKTTPNGNNPTLDDVFNKKTYYNPGKIISRLKQQIEKYNKMAEESEEKINSLLMEQMDPSIATNSYELTRLETAIQEEKENQNSILERLLELEIELEEMEG